MIFQGLRIMECLGLDKNYDSENIFSVSQPLHLFYGIVYSLSIFTQFLLVYSYVAQTIKGRGFSLSPTILNDEFGKIKGGFEILKCTPYLKKIIISQNWPYLG